MTSGRIASNGAAGVFALTYSGNESIDFTSQGGSYSNVSLGAVGTVTNTGTLTPANGTYRLGGAGGTLTLTAANALTGGNGLLVGAEGQDGSVVLLSGANNYTGGTTVSNDILNISNAGSLGSGSALVTSGGELAVSKTMTLNTPIALTGYGPGNSPANPSTYGALRISAGGAAVTLTGPITITNGAVISMYAAGANPITISQGITGTGDLTLAATSAGNGGATYTLNGQSTYSGNTILTSGHIAGYYLQVVEGINNALPTTTILQLAAQENSGAWDTNSYVKFALNGFNQQVAGLLSTNSQQFYITNMVVGGSSTLSTLTISNTVNTTFDGNLGGTGANENNLALVKLGSGVQTLSSVNGGNTYAGGTFIGQGALSISNTASLPGWNVNYNPGVTGFIVSNGAALAVGTAVSDANVATILGTTNFLAGASIGFDTTTGNRTNGFAIANGVNGALGLVKVGANTLVLTNANTFTGGVTINAGTLQINTNNNLGSTSSTLTLANGATLAVNQTTAEAITNPITLGPGGGTLYPMNSGIGGVTFSGAITGGGGLTTGNGVIIGGASIDNIGTLFLSTFGGLNGLCYVSNPDAFDNNCSVIVSNGTSLWLNFGTGAYATTNPIAFLSGGTLGTRAHSLTLTNATLPDGGNMTFSRDNATGVGNGNGTIVMNDNWTPLSSNLTIQVQTTSGYTNNLNVTLNGVLSGNYAVTNKLSGLGTLTLNGANTYTGDTVLLGGTNIIGNALALQNSTLQQSSSGTVAFAAGLTAATFGGLSGTSNIVLQTQDTSPLAVALTVGGNTSNTIYSGILSGSGSSLTKSGSGTLTLSGVNTYSGPTTNAAGTLAIGGTTKQAFGTGTLVLLGGSTLSPANNDVSNNYVIASGAVTINGNAPMYGTLSGAGNVTHIGGGAFTWAITGPSTGFSGNITNNGTIKFNDKNSLGLGTLYMVDGATLGLSGSQTLTGANAVTNNIVMTGTGQITVGNNNGTLELTGVISGAGGIQKGGNQGSLWLSGANTFTGDTSITNLSVTTASFVINNTLALQNSKLNYTSTNTAITFGTNITAVTLGALAGDQNLALTNRGGNAVALMVGNNSNSTAYSGILSGSGSSLTKVGTGTLTLSGANSYSGGTLINNGTLALSGSGAVGTGAIGIGKTGTFDVTGLSGGSYTLGSGNANVLTNRGTVLGGLVIGSGATASGGGIYQSLTVSSGGTLTPGVGGDTNYVNNLTLNNGSTNQFWLGSATNHDMTVVSNSLTYAGTSTSAPVLQLNLSSWVQSANVGETVVLYDNFSSGGWDGTNQLFQLSDTGGAFDGTLLTNGMFFTVSSSGSGEFVIHYDALGTDGSANDIMLTVIPEPASVNLLVMMGAAYLMRRRIHRKKSRWNF